MTDIAAKVLQKIKVDHITVMPRWYFVVKNIMWWGLSAAGITGSAVGIATIAEVIRMNDWDIYEELSGSLANFVVTTIPYAWLGIVSLLIIGSYILFVRTRYGYRYRLAFITLNGIIASSILGSVLYAAGVGSYVDNYVRAYAPAYHLALNPHARSWAQPEKGRIEGEVIETNQTLVVLADTQNALWHVDMAAVITTSTNLPRLNDWIRVIGSPTSNNHLTAKKYFYSTVQQKKNLIHHNKKRNPHTPSVIAPTTTTPSSSVKDKPKNDTKKNDETTDEKKEKKDDDRRKNQRWLNQMRKKIISRNTSTPDNVRH